MKKTINIFVSIAMVFGAFFSAFAVAPPAAAAVDVNLNTEILYLSDSMVSGDGISRIYTVELDENNDRANLTEILGSPIYLDQVDALAASENGDMLYAIDANTSQLMSLTVETGLHNNIGIVKVGSSVVGGIVLAATAPNGNLYAASQNTNQLYVVDLTTAAAVSKGKIYYDGTDINLNGADIVFATNGSMYLWTNSNKTGAPRGLYIVNNPLSLQLQATYVGEGTGNLFTGLAIRDNGLGDLVGSDTNTDSIVQISKIDGSMPVTYPMYLNGVRYAYSFGDMTAGPIINPLVISKTVDVSYDRTWVWDIDKSSTTNVLTLMPGETSTVYYDINVTATSTDSDWTVSGEITIHNPNVMAATITDVSDVIGTTTASTTCYVNNVEIMYFNYVLESEETMICLYEAVVPAGNTTNIATVETESTGLIEGNNIQEDVNADLPTNEYDETATLTDSQDATIKEEFTATLNSYEFNHSYALEVGPYDVSDIYSFENIATIITNDNEMNLNDNHVITVTVEEGVCTLTQGYWKTHSSYGPAPYDAIWNGLEDTNFYFSGQTYYQVLWTAPRGNSYYQLATQYIAAELNVLNEASVPTQVSEALAEAEVLFNTYTPEEVRALRGNNPIRKDFLNLASLLASYNEGMIGPGHCSD